MWALLGAIAIFIIGSMMVIIFLRRLYKLQSLLVANQSEFALGMSMRFDTIDKQQQAFVQQSQIFAHGQDKQYIELARQLEQYIADLKMKLMRQHNEFSQQQMTAIAAQNEKILSTLHVHQKSFNESQLKSVDQLVDHLTKASMINREEQAKSLQASSDQLTKQMQVLTESTENRLKEISAEVEKRLSEGFDKTTKTFNDILRRLALIDDAQKKITELSNNVVSLQEVLADKRSRGAFGEVQLNALIRNVLPEQHFALQHTLSNGKIADCVLFLPEPTGNVVIDSKFPLESYQRMMDVQLSESDRKLALRQFKADIRKHINDISEKYLIEKETSDGALMFIPAEAVFAEIHGHHSELVEYANKKRVWISSPTTLMAILTTARAVIKDEATREQIHIIQAHLGELAADFNRFKGRFNNLAKHIDQAAMDVKQIHTSANKISGRFEKIEQVELQGEPKHALERVNS
ncbi:DNA recombination protein RmuC [Thalassotalea fusca]